MGPFTTYSEIVKDIDEILVMIKDLSKEITRESTEDSIIRNKERLFDIQYALREMRTKADNTRRFEKNFAKL